MTCFISTGRKVSTLTGRPDPDDRAATRRDALNITTPPLS
jgi:hypothetical protein